MMRAIVGAMLGLALVACSPAPEQKAAHVPIAAPAPSPAVIANDNVLGPAAAWACGDGQRLSVTFYGAPDRAEIALADGARLNLYGSAAASGTLYEDSTHSFHAKGDDALLTFGDTTTTCHKED